MIALLKIHKKNTKEENYKKMFFEKTIQKKMKEVRQR